MHKKIHVKTKNKICAAVLVFVLAGSLTAGACAVPNVYAKTEAEKKRDAYKKKLKAKNSDIANIKDSQSDKRQHHCCRSQNENTSFQAGTAEVGY